MNNIILSNLPLFIVTIVLLIVCGLYCILVTRNFIRLLIGLEILTKAVTLLIVVVGYVTNNVSLAQTLIITMIVVEVVVIVVAAGLAISSFKVNGSLDLGSLKNLKG